MLVLFAPVLLYIILEDFKKIIDNSTGNYTTKEDFRKITGGGVHEHEPQ
jgi:hypothetical protein